MLCDNLACMTQELSNIVTVKLHTFELHITGSDVSSSWLPSNLDHQVGLNQWTDINYWLNPRLLFEKQWNGYGAWISLSSVGGRKTNSDYRLFTQTWKIITRIPNTKYTSILLCIIWRLCTETLLPDPTSPFIFFFHSSTFTIFI